MFEAIVSSLSENDETLLVQSGKPVGVFRTTPQSPGLIANSNLVPVGNLGDVLGTERLGLDVRPDDRR